MWGIVITALSSGAVVKIVDAILEKRKNQAKTKSAEVEASEDSFEALQKRVDYLSKALDEAYITAQKMQKIINEFRITNLALTVELAKAQMELAKAQGKE